MSELEAEFDAEVRTALAECHRLGYAPTRFEPMLESMGAVGLAKHFCKDLNIQYGLKKLVKMDRLHLSIEQIALKPKFKSLFKDDPTVLEFATWRLKLADEEKHGSTG